MMWDPIKWFVYRGSWRPLPALYKNSCRTQGLVTPGTEAATNLVSFVCLRSLLSVQSHQVAHSSFSHDTHSSYVPGGVHARCQSGVKWGIKVLVCARVHIHPSACMRTPNWQRSVMVLFPLTSPLKRCFRPLSLILLQLQNVREMSFLKTVCMLNTLKSKSVKLIIFYILCLDLPVTGTSSTCVLFSFVYQRYHLAHCSETLTKQSTESVVLQCFKGASVPSLPMF